MVRTVHRQENPDAGENGLSVYPGSKSRIIRSRFLLFWTTILSMSVTARSVALDTSWARRRPRRSPCPLTSFFNASFAHWRRLRTAILASFAFAAFLGQVTAALFGQGGRHVDGVSPIEIGFRPRSDSRIAFFNRAGHLLFVGLHAGRPRG